MENGTGREAKILVGGKDAESLSTQRRLRRIIVASSASLAVFLGGGVVASLLWPSHWNQLLGSLVLNIFAGLIGAAVAILTAILVVQKFLDDRSRDIKLTEQRYRSGWKIAQYQSVKLLAYLLTHSCLFIAFGRDRYLELAGVRKERASRIPESIHEFIETLPRETRVRIDEDTKESERDPEMFSRRDKDAWRECEVAFASRIVSPVSCHAIDVVAILSWLGELREQVQNVMWLMQPFMSEHMGMAAELADLSTELRAVSNMVKRHVTATMTEKPDSVAVLCVADIRSIMSLGQQAVKVADMISVGRDSDLRTFLGISRTTGEAS